MRRGQRRPGRPHRRSLRPARALDVDAAVPGLAHDAPLHDGHPSASAGLPRLLLDVVRSSIPSSADRDHAPHPGAVPAAPLPLAQGQRAPPVLPQPGGSSGRAQGLLPVDGQGERPARQPGRRPHHAPSREEVAPCRALPPRSRHGDEPAPTSTSPSACGIAPCWRPSTRRGCAARSCST